MFRTVVLACFFLINATPALAATNTPPVISGTPKTSVVAGTFYSFRPIATDADGNSLRFKIAKKPAWALFNPTTGRLRGTPTAANVGTFSGITIKVSDGTTTVALPAFSIVVTQAGTVPANSAPTITGLAVTAAEVGRPYAFQPTASDANGDTLTFSIQQKPTWASFDTTSGTLSGTPVAADVGTYSNVSISVSDGILNATLPVFAITVAPSSSKSVTLNWTAPSTNTDGTALSDLAGYTVFYGMASRAYSASIKLSGAAASSVVIEGLAAGTWYFSIKSTNVTGVESDYSGEVVAVL